MNPRYHTFRFKLHSDFNTAEIYYNYISIMHDESKVSTVVPKGKNSKNSYNLKANVKQHNLNKSFFYRGNLLWNSLPLEIREIRCLLTFKAYVKQHLWTHAFIEISVAESGNSLNDGIT